MTRRWPGFVLFGAMSVACSDETSTVVDVGPTGNPVLTLLSPEPCSEPPCACVAVTQSDARIPFEVAIEEVLLKPWRSCDERVQCGHLELTANGELNNAGLGRVIDLRLEGKADDYRTFDVTIAIINDAGAVLMNKESPPAPLEVSTTIITVPDASQCPTGGEGGSGGSGSGGSGGMGGMAGAGGLGGMGGAGGLGGAGGMGGAGGLGGAGGMGGSSGGAGGN